MNTEHAEYINRCETAFNKFIDATPDFVNSEENNRSLIAALDRLGLTYDRASHLELAFRSIKSKKPTTAAPAPAAAPQAESFEASVEREANRILDSGELTDEILHRMTSKQVEIAQRSYAWSRAVDILEARRVKQVLAPADVTVAEKRALANGTTVQSEISRAQQQMNSVAAHNQRPANSSPAQRSSGIANTHQMATWSTRRKQTPAQIEAQRKADNAWIEEQESIAARRRRVLAHRKGK
jgi:hypothetical protein